MISAELMTVGRLRAELNDLERRWDRMRADLEESGGASGSPGEWMAERMSELRATLRYRENLRIGSASHD